MGGQCRPLACGCGLRRNHRQTEVDVFQTQANRIVSENIFTRGDTADILFNETAIRVLGVAVDTGKHIDAGATEGQHVGRNAVAGKLASLLGQRHVLGCLAERQVA